MLATFTVSSTADDGPGSLRAAVDAANAQNGLDIVNFAPALAGAQIVLNHEILITDSVHITAFGLSERPHISAQGGDPTPGIVDGAGIRIFRVETVGTGVVGFANLHLSGGDVTGAGGAIRTVNDIFIEDCVFVDNHASQHGAAVSAELGFLSTESLMVRSLFQFNSAGGRGGAVDFNSSRSGLSVSESQFIGNRAATSGGGLNIQVKNALSGFEFKHSVATGNTAGIGNGGAIQAQVEGPNAPRLLLHASTFSDNEALGGGALYLEARGTTHMQIVDATIDGNRTTVEPGGGGFLVARDASKITVSQSTVRANSALHGGGLNIRNFSNQTMHIAETTIENNTATHGGGLSAEIFSGNMLVDASTLTGNTAMGNGGGTWVAAQGGGFELRSSTVSGNAAVRHGGGIYLGGNQSTPLQIHHSTIAFNSARTLLLSYGTGGGIHNRLGNTALLNHTIVANNDANVAGNDTHGQFDSSYNVIQEVGAATLIGMVNDILGVNPELEPLAANGGLTRTHALRGTSPAVNSGSAASGGLPQFDQRGDSFPRVQFGRVDRGAFEYDLHPDGDFNGDLAWDCADIDQLVAAVAAATYDIRLDMTADGVLDEADIADWLATAGAINLPSGAPFRFGDANLDGVVDGLDFIIWNDHKFTARPSWCSGDFNADGIVDGLDFVIWNQFKFQSFNHQPIGERDAIWLALDKGSVPGEPVRVPAAWHRTEFGWHRSPPLSDIMQRRTDHPFFWDCTIV